MQEINALKHIKLIILDTVCAVGELVTASILVVGLFLKGQGCNEARMFTIENFREANLC